METTWILVADRTRAKLFESKGPGKGALQHLRDIPHPEGRLQARDMEADKPGRISDSFGTRHAMSPHHEPEERHAQEFAHHLAEVLNKGRNDHAYQKLILVAEPGFLGDLSGALDKNTSALVEKTVGKDLMHVGKNELPQHLS
jgi:protein required for attachment to host cells